MIPLAPSALTFDFQCGCGDHFADWPALEEHWYTAHQPPWDIKMRTIHWVISTVIILFIVMGVLVGMVGE